MKGNFHSMPAGGLLCALLVLPPAQAASPQQMQQAIEDCSACHRVTQGQGPVPSVYDPDQARNIAPPSFDVIARRYAGRPAALARFIQAPRHPMREQRFLPRDLKAILRYIASLRKERW